MKIVITGHTKGVGKSFYDLALNKGHSVTGLSRSTGNDISDDSIIEKIIDADVFINNAYAPIYQTKLLEKVLKEWKGKDKLVINLSSKFSFTNTATNEKVKQYIKDKSAQNVIMQRQSLEAYPKVCNVILGLVDTDMSSMFKSKNKMEAQDIADLIFTLIEHKNLTIQEIVLESPGLNWYDIELGE